MSAPRGSIAALAKLRTALLVMHAPRDHVVGIENAAELFTAARHPKSFITLDDADHLLSRERDAEYAADVISAWSARYLDLAEEASADNAPEGVGAGGRGRSGRIFVRMSR